MNHLHAFALTTLILVTFAFSEQTVYEFRIENYQPQNLVSQQLTVYPSLNFSGFEGTEIKSTMPIREIQYNPLSFDAGSSLSLTHSVSKLYDQLKFSMFNNVGSSFSMEPERKIAIRYWGHSQCYQWSCGFNDLRSTKK